MNRSGIHITNISMTEKNYVGEQEQCTDYKCRHETKNTDVDEQER